MTAMTKVGRFIREGAVWNKRYVIAREGNVIRVDFPAETDPPAPKFPGAAALRQSQLPEPLDVLQSQPDQSGGSMRKALFAFLMAGTLLVPPATSAVGNESTGSVVRNTEWQNKDFAAYLPPISAETPWLNLDSRTKLPKGNFPLGREADSIGALALKPIPNMQVSGLHFGWALSEAPLVVRVHGEGEL